MSPRESDAARVEALRAGDSQAFERLYSEYSAPIYNLCARVVCDREEAKDLTQDVFITAFNQLRDSSAEPVRKLKPWLYRVATNACYNHLRSRNHLDGGGDAQLEGAACDVDEYQRAETVALVEASLGQLNERYRTALVLKDLQGLEAAEIAEVMEVSRPNADVLVHRARASFKAAFAKLAGDAPAPAALGMVLLPLSLPAALQALPSFAHPVAPPAHTPAPAPHAPAGHGLHLPHLAHAGPAGAGLLTKIGAALTTKIGITAAAATLVVGGTVAVKEVQHSHAAHRRTGAPGHAWQAPSSKWSKNWARWNLYGHWMKHGWPRGWNSGRWMWNGSNDTWSWSMDSGSTWSSTGMTSDSSSWSGDGSWTMTMSRSGSSGWSSGGSWTGSGSKSGSGRNWSGNGSGSGNSGTWKGASSGGGSGSGSGNSGSWKGSSSFSGSGSGWNSGSGSGNNGSWGGFSGGMNDSGSSGGSSGGLGGGSGW